MKDSQVIVNKGKEMSEINVEFEGLGEVSLSKKYDLLRDIHDEKIGNISNKCDLLRDNHDENTENVIPAPHQQIKFSQSMHNNQFDDATNSNIACLQKNLEQAQPLDHYDDPPNLSCNNTKGNLDHSDKSEPKNAQSVHVLETNATPPSN